ncbi:E3 ubiquitin ligase [Exophiala oligosperma]
MSATDASPNPAASEMLLLSSFQKHIEDMRNLSLCKICIKPFYEPFILACGHTYCYSCLANWFGCAHNRHKKKNCPDCRAEVTLQPSPNFLLRDLVHMFIGRAELLPEDETVAEHQKAKDDEAGQLAADRAGQGLFKGVFKHQHTFHIPSFWARGILDHEDNVMRCPECHWELEDGQCVQCGFNEYDSGESDLDDESIPSPRLDTDEYYDEDSEIDMDFDGPIQIGTGYETDRTDASHTDYDEYDDEDGMDGFIERDDAPIQLHDDSDETRSVSTITGHRVSRHNTLHSSADETDPWSDPQTPPYAVQGTHHYDDEDRSVTGTEMTDQHTVYDDPSEESEDDQGPISRLHPHRQFGVPSRRNRRRIISDDEEDEDNSDATAREPIPLDNSEDGSDNGHDFEDEDEDRDEDEDEDEDESPRAESDSDSDDIRPPQSAARRMQHLDTQRGRRGEFRPYMPYPTHHGSSYNSRINHPRPPRSGQYSAPAYGRRIPVGGGSRHC